MKAWALRPEFVAQTTPPPNKSRIVWKGCQAVAQRITTAIGDTLQSDANGVMQTCTIIPLSFELGVLAKTDPGLATVLGRYVEAIEDAQGKQVWP